MQHQERPEHGKAFARAITTTTIALMSIGLLAGSAVGVAAQDEETRPPELLPQLREIFMSTSPELPASAAVDYSGRAFDLAPETPIYYTWENGEWPEIGDGARHVRRGDRRSHRYVRRLDPGDSQ